MFHYKYGTMYFSCLQIWEIKERHQTHYKCLHQAEAYIIPSEHILEAVVHASASLGDISTVLIPLHLRQIDAREVFSRSS